MTLRAWLPSILAICWIGPGSVIFAEDVTFSSRHDSGRPESADFYYDGQAIGRGREGFLAIINRIRELPAGSSVVWGPNYARCGSCGSGPACVPKFLYPDLWTELETLVKERRLTLSSDYPSAWPVSVVHSASAVLPKLLSADAGPPGGKFDATLDVAIGLPIGIEDAEQPANTIWDRGRWYRLRAGKKTFVDHYDLDLFLAELPADSRLLIRVRFDQLLKPDSDENSPVEVAAEIRGVWRNQFEVKLRRGNVRATLDLPKDLIEPWNAIPESLSITWQNYHGPGTLHAEVLYEVNGEYVGRGDRGFDAILARLKKTDPKTKLILPRYEYSGRRAYESGEINDIEKENDRLRDAVPFIARKAEFDELLDQAGLEIESDGVWPGDAPTVLEWSGGDRSGSSLVSMGRIVHHDEQPSPPKVQLAWTNYKTDVRANENKPRQPESEAVYTLDGVETGAGVEGFLAAMKSISALPEKSVVHVRVCIRTKGPFTCPITFAGQRHFERTGFEPCFGMFPLLIDVARKKNLVLEWIPDEAKSCADCALNK